MPAPTEASMLARKIREGAELSEGYSHDLARGKRRPSLKMALKIYRGAGVKLGPIEHANEADIEALERLA